MIQITPHHTIVFCVQSIDFRKGIDGLSSVCRNFLKSEPTDGAVFIFSNKRKIAVKILVYDSMGFWLCIRRFSKGKLAWWPKSYEQAKSLTYKELHVILVQGNPTLCKIPKDFLTVKKCH